MADLFQTEATRTMIAAGYWAEKFPDMRFERRGQVVSKPHAETRMYPTRGRPDMYYLMPSTGAISLGGFIEVKTGQGKFHQRFAYSEWRAEQRQWYDRHARHTGINLWFFLVLGGRIGGKAYPRTAYLFPARTLEALEQTDTRRSLSYDRAMRELRAHQLVWAGDQTWMIPDDHPFKAQERESR